MEFSETFGRHVSRTRQRTIETAAVGNNSTRARFTSMAKSKIFCLLNMVRANSLRIVRSTIFSIHIQARTIQWHIFIYIQRRLSAASMRARTGSTHVLKFFIEFCPSHEMSVLSTTNHLIECFIQVRFLRKGWPLPVPVFLQSGRSLASSRTQI